ncbi:uncharacterized protein N7483_003974 [Penicillium malachiteum]|uniref:uncharacterized protein n=1 Tax=Penicillium malachiteum TaxID=1324776 RepID=UPI002549297A|nr:uncharacterized protein N7483_003974 [Penicillium malachiteum]KAJ5729466.1 hypothetical protein N7483_003974 [Penicillium malachiteum]
MEDPTHGHVPWAGRFEALLRDESATRKEKSMTLAEGIRLYPKAIAWSILLSSTLIMEGYDLALLGSMYDSPAFKKKFGKEAADGEWNISAAWQLGLANGARCGEIVGLLICGQVFERLGYRRTMSWALLAICLIIFLFFYAVNIQMLLAAEILAGIPWGIFQTLPVLYASEVCRIVLRPYLTTFINMCWVIGQFVAAGVNRTSVLSTDEQAYNIKFGVQWVWIPALAMVLLFAPESPWWITVFSTIEETIVMIQHTNRFERSHVEGTGYLDCFKDTNLRRTEIVCVVWMVQTLCGSNLMDYFAYFCLQAGIPPIESFELSMAKFTLGFFGTFVSWFLISVAGRRAIHMFGLATLFILLVIIGSLGFAPASNEAAKLSIAAILITFTFFFDFTIGPVTYSLVSELSSTRLKAKTIVLARVLHNISKIVVALLTHYQLKETAWDWGAKTAYFWAGTCLFCLIWAYFRLPEPRGRAYKELDLLFERGTPARKFSATRVDAYVEELMRMQEGARR